ncbi:MAG: undecaprenyldiphospho-muramoylpentapeptide beta-N-acetylglucosaminyltransferase [Chitinispirillaceae bacterium]|jgi:UDP-N-acetylglucosamine--N-acetylmuramyl-(pentapeptide) pyrophosphoryl-undecaprenol N-acetylglucosamine transferase|nr:undecaprenyldiphospho-muramoylpentapeptide beta-N-acetylglucosaminyltransferase [Chitinispirillaceae bacterium]
METRILFTGGGTAGHVTPNLALLPALRARGYAISYIGTAAGIEHELVGRENLPYHAIPAGKLRRYWDRKNISDILSIAAGFFQSLNVIRKIRPAVLFSKGGFVSCPVVWAAWLCRVPVIIHESDIVPGLANKLSIPFATRVCYSFPETAAHVPKKKSVLTGIPVRARLFAGDAGRGRILCGFTDAKPVILIIGGSQGARSVNAYVVGALDRLLPSYNICHICGSGNLTGSRPGYVQFEYVNDELADLFALADLVVSRAGATTLFELAALKKPNLLIPLPLSASRGDQILNARSFEKQGWSRVLTQERLSVDSLVEKIGEVAADSAAMIKRMSENAPIHSSEKIIQLIESFVKRQ